MPEPQQANTPTALRFPAGLNNRARETALPDGALRQCTNLDVTNEGGVLVRAGLRLLASGVWNSLFTPSFADYCCAVRNGWLGIWQNDAFTPIVEVTPPVCYAELNGEVYWSDGELQGRLTATGAAATWGLEAPPQPVVVAVTGQGGLASGDYQVALTALVGGLESGALSPVPVTVAAGGGIQVTAPAAPGTVSFAVYCTPPNGSSAELTQALHLAGGATAVIGAGESGRRLETLGAVKPLPAQALCVYRGRLWAASGTVVWFTDEASPHWLFPERGYFQFEAPVTLLAAAEDGIYVAAGERTYFLQGRSPQDMTQRPVLAAGAVPGTQLSAFPFASLLSGPGAVPTQSCAWLATDGVFCIGRAGGMVSRVTEAALSLAVGEQGHLAYWTHDGLRSFLLAVTEGQVSNAAHDVAVAAVWPQGVALNA